MLTSTLEPVCQGTDVLLLCKKTSCSTIRPVALVFLGIFIITLGLVLGRRIGESPCSRVRDLKLFSNNGGAKTKML